MPQLLPQIQPLLLPEPHHPHDDDTIPTTHSDDLTDHH
jgi:hypothetical protein